MEEDDIYSTSKLVKGKKKCEIEKFSITKEIGLLLTALLPLASSVTEHTDINCEIQTVVMVKLYIAWPY